MPPNCGVSLRFGSQDAQPGGFSDRLPARRDVQLLVDVVGVLRHGARGDYQLNGDLLVAELLRQQRQHLEFALG